MIITQVCMNCQENFPADSREIKRGNAKYCSRKCSGEARAKNRVELIPNVECAWCQLPLYRKPAIIKRSKTNVFFCNREHQSLAFSDPTHPASPGPKSVDGTIKSRRCLRCTRKYQSKLDHCSECRKEIIIELWLAGDNAIASLPNGEAKTFVKRYLTDTRGDKCERCDFVTPVHWFEKYGSIITMDHKDGHYDNNLIENLELLCPNCHAMTETFGSRNRGNGRGYRMDRYYK